MTWLLDTNVVSEWRKQRRASRHVARWFREHADDEFWLSVLVVGELRRGVEQLERRDPVAANSIGTWVDTIVAEFGDRILPVDLEVAEASGALALDAPISDIDALLAATARRHGLTLATRDATLLARADIPTVNPFEPS